MNNIQKFKKFSARSKSAFSALRERIKNDRELLL